MSSKPVYLDYAATTPVDKSVVEKMLSCMSIEGTFGNPASRSHMIGWQAEQAVELARKQVASLVNCDPREIVWTSGATESDNLAIKGVALHYQHQGKHLITSKIEHKAVLDSFVYLESQGFEVTYLTPDANGMISLDMVQDALREDTTLVSLMHVNNEIGVINDISAIGAMLRERSVWFHVDAAQSAGKLALDLSVLSVDLMSFSGHKVYGPKGIGALYVSRQSGVKVDAQIHGGGHERGMRSGTLPTHQIVGMGEAFAIAEKRQADDLVHVTQLRDRFLAAIKDLDGVTINGDMASRYAGNLNLGFEGVDGETLLMSLPGLAVSSGSACTSDSMEPSYVLMAIGVPANIAQSSLRVSFGRETTKEQVDLAAKTIIESVNRLRSC